MKDHPFMSKHVSRTWVGVGLAPIRTVEKPKLILVGSSPQEGPDIFIDVVGLRNDGCEFTIAVGVDSEKLGKCNPAEVLLGVHQQLQIAFAKLQSYKDCACKKGFVCKVHQPPVQN